MINNNHYTIVTAGSNYLDIDAYACCVAMKELLCLQGQNAVAYSTAQVNYSVCDFLTASKQIDTTLPGNLKTDSAQYAIVDVSDPSYIQEGVPSDRVIAVYDHHTGFEEYWKERIGSGTHIEFIGAAATLIFREWKIAYLQDKMSQHTALLLIAAILDNTLNLKSSNTTHEDIEAFRELCSIAGVDEKWRAVYFSEVQRTIEADLENALLKDVKHISTGVGLPEYIGQIALWNAASVFRRIDSIRELFSAKWQSWMLNIIDIEHHKGYFVCDDPDHEKRISRIFGVSFTNGITELSQPYLRKQIIKEAEEEIND